MDKKTKAQLVKTLATIDGTLASDRQSVMIWRGDMRAISKVIVEWDKLSNPHLYTARARKK